jgi:hypothetical protein
MGREATNGDGAGNGNGHSDAIVAAVAEPSPEFANLLSSLNIAPIS